MGISLVGLLGCTPTNQFRAEPIYSPETGCAKGAAPLQCPIGFAPKGRGYRYGVVEFDDQGELLDNPPQYDFVRRNIDASSHPEPGFKGKIVIVFAHGWFHTAAPGDSNLALFKTMLDVLAQDEKAVAESEKRPRRLVEGVFLAWRGGNINIPGVELFTFWNRKETAQRIGERRVTEVLLGLRETAYSGEYISDEVPNRFIVMGHSFGGALAFSAMSQLIANHLMQPPAPPSSRYRLADAIILFNPAFEAARSVHVLDAASVLDRRLPLLSIFTAKNDRATGWAFPAARFANTITQAYRSGLPNPVKRGKKDGAYSQRSADTQTIGHYSDFLTHSLVLAKADNKDCSPDASRVTATYEEVTSKTPQNQIDTVGKANKIESMQKTLMDDYEAKARILNFGSTCLVRDNAVVNAQSAVINVAVDSDIWNGHTIEQDDTRRKLITNFLEQYIPFAATADVIPEMQEVAAPAQGTKYQLQLQVQEVKPRRRAVRF